MTATLELFFRQNAGQKGVLRASRAQGMVPGIIYGGKTKEGVPVSLPLLPLQKEISRKGIKSRLYKVTYADAQKKTVEEDVLVRDIQFHPLKDVPTHIDFMRVTEGSVVHVNLRLAYVHESKSPGLKRGGILNVVAHTLDVVASVENIPEAIEISLEGRNVGDSIHLRDLTLPKGVEVLHLNPEQTLATIVAPSGLAKEEETEEAEESAS
jgi:large subunit ribosomal protein L25